jgi:hypothetical protein
VTGALRPPPGKRRIAIAVFYGAVCHAVFGAAVLAMIIAMFFGMSASLGAVPHPWSVLANAALLLAVPDCALAAADWARPRTVEQVGATGLRSDAGDDHLRDCRLAAAACAVCVLDTEWCDLVAGRGLGFLGRLQRVTRWRGCC